MTDTVQTEVSFPAADGVVLPGVRTVPTAGHSFMTRTPGLIGRVGPLLPLHAEYHEPSARDAHRRIVAFFHTHLDGQDENHG